MARALVGRRAQGGGTLLLRVLVEGLAMRAVRDPGLAKEPLGRLLTDAIARVLGE